MALLDPFDELGAPLDDEVVDADELALLDRELEELEVGSVGRGFESVTYQPEPLKMIPAGKRTRRNSPPQVGQTLSGSSLNFCLRSTRDLHPRHSYS